MTTYIAVDIGVSGAVAWLDGRGILLRIEDMPCLQDGPAGRRAINAPLLAEMIREGPVSSEAFVELVGPRPGEGAVGAFSFGRSKGTVEGVLGALGIPVRFLTPPQWKRVIGLPPGKEKSKDASRAEAVRRWPSRASLFSRKMDNGRSDAALIGMAGILKFHNGIA